MNKSEKVHTPEQKCSIPSDYTTRSPTIVLSNVTVYSSSSSSSSSSSPSPSPSPSPSQNNAIKKRSLSLPLDISQYYEEQIIDLNHAEYVTNHSKIHSETEFSFPERMTSESLSKSTLCDYNHPMHSPSTYSNILHHVKKWFSLQPKKSTYLEQNDAFSSRQSLFENQGLCNDL